MFKERPSKEVANELVECQRIIGGWGDLGNGEGTRKGMLEEPETAMGLQQDKVVRKVGGAPDHLENGVWVGF